MLSDPGDDERSLRRATRGPRRHSGRLQRCIRRRRPAQILTAAFVLHRDGTHDPEGAAQAPAHEQQPAQSAVEPRPGAPGQDPPDRAGLPHRPVLAQSTPRKLIGRVVP